MNAGHMAKSGGQRGLSVLAVMITLMLLVILALVAASLISLRSNISSEEVNSKRALYIAEAGLSVAKYTLKSNWAQWSNPDAFPLTQFAGGTFDATVTAGVDPNMQVIVTSTGIYSNSKRIIQATIERYGVAMRNAIFTNGDCDLNGNVGINGDVSYSGNYVEGGNVHVTGDISQTDQIIPGLNSDEAISEARANHQNGFSTRPDGNYFQGTFSPNPNGTLNGVIYIDRYPDSSPASVEIAGNLETSGEDPAFLIVIGDLRISGNVDFRGVIYTAGFTDIDITLLGNMSIDGALFTSGNVTMRGNATITYDEDMIINQIITDLMTGEDSPQEESWKEINQ